MHVSRCVIHELAIPLLVIGSTPKSMLFSAEVPDDDRGVARIFQRGVHRG